MTDKELDLLTQQVEKLSQRDQLLFLERLVAMIRNQLEETTEIDADSDVTWTDEEIAELLTPKEPMTGKKMVEAGLIGGWEHMGIEDSAEWVNEQRAKRRKKLNW